ncbi:MAG: hypothetical protein ACI8RZ_000982 [Myxococcota bacterium]|jgi:hypothetical protein
MTRAPRACLPQDYFGEAVASPALSHSQQASGVPSSLGLLSYRNYTIELNEKAADTHWSHARAVRDALSHQPVKQAGMHDHDHLPALRDLCELLAGRRVVALTGAGCSTDSGIPDYRGPETRKKARNPIQ